MLTLPEGFSLHDLRHYLASLLISSGADIRTVQARMRHASARIRLDVYGHLWRTQTSPPARRGAVIAERMDSLRPADGLASEPAYMQVKGFADLHVELERELRPGRCHGLAVTVAEEPAGQSCWLSQPSEPSERLLRTHCGPRNGATLAPPGFVLRDNQRRVHKIPVETVSRDVLHRADWKPVSRDMVTRWFDDRSRHGCGCSCWRCEPASKATSTGSGGACGRGGGRRLRPRGWHAEPARHHGERPRHVVVRSARGHPQARGTLAGVGAHARAVLCRPMPQRFSRQRPLPQVRGVFYARMSHIRGSATYFQLCCTKW